MTSLVQRSTGALLVGAIALTSLTGCGKESVEESGATEPCFTSLKAVALPADDSFPKDWPLPPHTVVTEVKAVPGVTSGSSISALVGADFKKVLPFMQKDLEKAGFIATKGEAEHDDAEAVWAGNGYSGTWAIKEDRYCKGTTILQIAAQKDPVG